MRSIATSEVQFQQQAVVDQDIDGTGEYGLLNELAGITTRRDYENGYREKIDPPFIALKYAVTTESGYTTVSRYHIQVFLPLSQNKTLTDNATGYNGISDEEAIDLQEQFFILYSWPTGEGYGKLCFAADQSGEIVRAKNLDANGDLLYQGEESRPSFNSAFDENLQWGIAADGQAKDGQKWRSTN